MSVSSFTMLSPGLGLGNTLHWLPSQCSMRVNWPVKPGPRDPTAHTSFGASGATAFRALYWSTLGLDNSSHPQPVATSGLIALPNSAGAEWCSGLASAVITTAPTDRRIEERSPSNKCHLWCLTPGAVSRNIAGSFWTIDDGRFTWAV